jgi:hypothetical protein
METSRMAKITLTEAVRVSLMLDGKAVELDLTAGDTDVEQVVADLLIAQGVATYQVEKTTTKKSPSTAPVVEDTPIETNGDN